MPLCRTCSSADLCPSAVAVLQINAPLQDLGISAATSNSGNEGYRGEGDLETFRCGFGVEVEWVGMFLEWISRKGGSGSLTKMV